MDGIVYKSINLGSKDKIAYLITEKGYISLLLKKAQDPVSSNLIYSQPLTLIKFTLKETESDLKKPIDIEILDDFLDIKENYEAFKSAQIVLKVITDTFKENSDLKNIYPLLVLFLNYIKLDLSYFYQMLLKLTYFLGIGFSKELLDTLIIDNKLKENIIKLYKEPFNKIDFKNIKIDKERISNFISKYYIDNLEYRIIGLRL